MRARSRRHSPPATGYQKKRHVPYAAKIECNQGELEYEATVDERESLAAERRCTRTGRKWRCNAVASTRLERPRVGRASARDSTGQHTDQAPCPKGKMTPKAKLNRGRAPEWVEDVSNTRRSDVPQNIIPRNSFGQRDCGKISRVMKLR